MTTSRYTRTTAATTSDTTKADSARAANEPAPPSPVAGAGGVAEYQDLVKRLDGLRERRRRHEYDLDRAEREISECLEQARALGVETLEELEALVEKQEAEDRQAMAQFVQALDAEETLLDGIDQRLAQTQGN